ncbi:hypothetical protein [Escherichia coli]|uniref:hypothetical protein n=1 Tax=Escherichia coli TaxID=562 RepID=UPI00207BC660|nr:hypothetical protein [Escherichia coli]
MTRGIAVIRLWLQLFVFRKFFRSEKELIIVNTFDRPHHQQMTTTGRTTTMVLTTDLLKSLNNIRQNATIYVHAYKYADAEKDVMVPRTSLPSLRLAPLQSEKIINLLLNGTDYIRHDGYTQGYGEKTVATFTIQGDGHHHFRTNLALNKTGNIADNALNQWLHRIRKTDIIVLSVVLTE